MSSEYMRFRQNGLEERILADRSMPWQCFSRRWLAPRAFVTHFAFLFHAIFLMACNSPSEQILQIITRDEENQTSGDSVNATGLIQDLISHYNSLSGIEYFGGPFSSGNCVFQPMEMHTVACNYVRSSGLPPVNLCILQHVSGEDIHSESSYCCRILNGDLLDQLHANQRERARIEKVIESFSFEKSDDIPFSLPLILRRSSVGSVSRIPTLLRTIKKCRRLSDGTVQITFTTFCEQDSGLFTRASFHNKELYSSSCVMITPEPYDVSNMCTRIKGDYNLFFLNRPNSLGSGAFPETALSDGNVVVEPTAPIDEVKQVLSSFKSDFPWSKYIIYLKRYPDEPYPGVRFFYNVTVVKIADVFPERAVIIDAKRDKSRILFSARILEHVLETNTDFHGSISVLPFLPPPAKEEVDAYIARHRDLPTDSDDIRRIVHIGLRIPGANRYSLVIEQSKDSALLAVEPKAIEFKKVDEKWRAHTIGTFSISH